MRGNLLETIISAISHSIKCSSGAFLCRRSPPLMTGGRGGRAPMTNTSYPYLPVDNMHELIMANGANAWLGYWIYITDFCIQMRNYTCPLTCRWENWYSTWPSLDSYFILWGRGARGKEKENKREQQRFGHYKPLRERLAKGIVMHPLRQGSAVQTPQDVCHFCRDLM